jgi:hypothetical protein
VREREKKEKIVLVYTQTKSEVKKYFIFASFVNRLVTIASKSSISFVSERD